MLQPPLRTTCCQFGRAYPRHIPMFGCFVELQLFEPSSENLQPCRGPMQAGAAAFLQREGDEELCFNVFVSMVFMSQSGQHQSFLEFVGRNRVQEARNPCVFHGKKPTKTSLSCNISLEKHHNSIQTSVIISCTLSCFICF